MKKILFCCLLGIISLTANAGNPKRVILIALDGISINGFTKANTPHLDALLSEGALSLNTRVVMPSVTLPNWTSHLTGSGPEQHGVFNNDWTLADSHYPLPITRQGCRRLLPFSIYSNQATKTGNKNSILL